MNERDVVQYKSDVRNKLQMMGVLQKFEELYEKNLSFGKLRYGQLRHEVEDEESVTVNMKSSSPPPVKKRRTT